MPDHANVHAALCAAQAEFAPAVKNSNNPAFRSKYADLQSCIEAVGPALNKHGIAYYWDAIQDEGQWVVECHLVHAATTTAITCAWPVIIDKANAQGFASGSTYARRYSLMAVTGLAPEDDDGNAAASQNHAKPSVPPQVAQARAQANALVARVREALAHGEDAWLMDHVVSAAPAVRAAIADQLTPEQVDYLRGLKDHV
jgi:hypothetical protein